MTEQQIVWEEPPAAAHGGRGSYDWFYKALRQRPGQWAKYPKLLKNGAVGSYPQKHPGFEFVIRKEKGTKLHAMYVRYIGDDEK